MSSSPDRLYQLLPAIYRYRDYYDGEPLRSLMGVFQTVFDQVEADITQLNENWFIETCAPELIPYIADLVGLRDLGGLGALAASDRALVGNAIPWRRRKGTASALPDLIRAVTGWHTRVRESRELVASTHHVRDPEPSRGLMNVRKAGKLRSLDGPFETSVHTVSVRPADRSYPVPSAGYVSPRGKYNIPFVAISFWRLRAYRVTYREPSRVPGDSSRESGLYSVHPFGVRAQLFNPPQHPDPGTERGVPVPLDPEVLRKELDSWRHVLHSHRVAPAHAYKLVWFGEDPVVDIRVRWDQDADYQKVEPANIYIPDGEISEVGVPRGATGYCAMLDPATGLLRFLNCEPPRDVRVAYSYGFSGDIGGGPYQPPADHHVPPPSAWRAQVIRNWSGSSDADPNTGYQTFATIGEALDEWCKDTEMRTAAFIRISDSAIYDLDRSIVLNGQQLTISAWDGQCPVIRGTIHVHGKTGNPANEGDCPVEGDTRPASLVIQGVWLEGGLELEGQINVEVCDSTIRAQKNGGAAISARPDRPCSVNLQVGQSLVGRIDLPADSGASIKLQDSIAEGISGPRLIVRTSTIFGEVHVSAIEEATLSIFADLAIARERNLGSVSLCSFAPGSETPLRVRCLHDSLRPAFTSTRHGDPGYAQLSAHCPDEFFHWPEDGGEVGAFHCLGQNLRRTRLRRALEEFLPFHLEGQVFYET